MVFGPGSRVFMLGSLRLFESSRSGDLRSQNRSKDPRPKPANLVIRVSLGTFVLFALCLVPAFLLGTLVLGLWSLELWSLESLSFGTLTLLCFEI